MPSAAPRRRLIVVSALAAIFAIPATVGASGTITTTGATITLGSNAAIVSIDPAAPPSALPTLTPAVAPPAPPPAPSILTAPLATPGPGAPFHATANVTIPGGTYDVTDVTIDPGVTVTMSGAVTIRASGNVVVQGRSVSASDGASIVLEAAGSITLSATSALAPSGIETTGAASPISLRAATGIFATTTASSHRTMIRTADGAIDVATLDATSILELRATDIESGSGDVTLAAAQDLGFTSVNVTAATGTARTWSGRNTSLYSGLIEGSDGVACTAAGGTFDAPFATIRSSAAAPALSSVAVRAGGAVRLTGTYLLAPGVSAPVLVESGAAISVGGEVAATEFAMISAGGSLRLSATTGLTLNGGSTLSVFGASGRAETAAGALIIAPGVRLRSVGGDLTFVAPTIDVRQSEDPDPSRLDADAAGGLVFRATGGAASVAADVTGTTRFEIAASTDVSFRGSAEGTESVRIASATGSVTIAGASLEGRPTTPTGARTSGDVIVESHGSAGATIDATGATLVTRPATERAGSVLLLIHDAATAPAALLPRTLTMSRTRRSDGRRTLRLAGTADLGLAARRFAGRINVVAGPVTSLGLRRTSDGRIQRFQSDDGSARLSFKESASGSSRGTIVLSVTAEFPGTDPFSGTLAVAVADAVAVPGPRDAQAAGRFTLTDGRYADTPATRVAPVTALRSAAWKRGRTGQGTFALVATVPLPSERPETAPAVGVRVVEYGASPVEFSFSADAESFLPQGATRHRSRTPSAGAGSVTLDYGKGTVTVALHALTLPEPGDPESFDGSFEITIDGARVVVPARLARIGPRTLY